MYRILTMIVVCAGSVQGQVLRVDADAAPGGDGLSWGRAFNSLTDALAASSSGNELWVAEGTYVPVSPAGRDATFTVPSGVAVYGGFGGNESSITQRNPAANHTELSGSGVDPYSVVTILAPGTGTAIDGITITKGLADGIGAAARTRGAGVYADDATPTLRNLTISLCQSTNPGAAVHLGGDSANSATIDGCKIVSNSGDSAVSVSVPVTISDTDFGSNAAGALWLDGSTQNLFQLVLDCAFIDHPAQNSLAPVVVNHNSPTAIAQINGALFESNQGLRAGAVYFLGEGDHEIINTIFRGNSVTLPTVSGGAIYIDMDSAADSVQIENSLLIGNSCPGQGGAISKNGPETLRIIGTTITGNMTGAAFGAGIEHAEGLLDLDNSIVYDNTGIGLPDQRRSIFITGGTATADRCLIQFKGIGTMVPSISGFGTTGQDPLFVDADGPDNTFGTSDDNVRPSPGSPAIDAGNNLFVGPFVFADIYSANRFADDTGTPDTGDAGGLPPVVDIGAAEFQGTTPTDCVADTNGDGLLSPADFSAWIIAFNAQSTACDQNGDGNCTPADFSAWVINYNAGCN